MTNKQSYATPSAAIRAFCEESGEDLRTELEGFIWETFHSINGIKPRWYEFREWTEQELVDEVDALGRQVQQAREWEEQASKEKIAAANRKALEARRFDKSFGSLSAAFG